MDIFRVGVVGLTHDHIWHHVSDLAQSQAISVVAVSDEHEDAISAFLDVVRVERTYARHEDLLDHETLDFVMIYADNRSSAGLAVLAMQRGVSVIVEKPMASTLAGADTMLTMANASGVRLMVNWPVAWYPAFRHALDLARAGRIGAVTHVDYRAAHQGPKEFGCSERFCEWLYDARRNGGGALMDYCSYGALATYALLGTPHRVHATAGRFQKDYIQVDDNALLTMEYPRAMGTAQASWSQIGPGRGSGPVIYGTGGTIVVHQRSGTREGHVIREGQIELMTLDEPNGIMIDPPELSPGERGALEHFVACMRGEAALVDLVAPDTGRAVQEILEAGYRSVELGCNISLPLRPDPSSRQPLPDA